MTRVLVISFLSAFIVSFYAYAQDGLSPVLAPVLAPAVIIPEITSEEIEIKEETKEKERVDLALKYHLRCLENLHVTRSIKTRESFCGCSAEQALEKLSLIDLKTMATGKGPEIQNRYIEKELEAPCLSYVIGEVEFNKCISSYTYMNMFRSQKIFEGMCHCVEKNMAGFVQQYGAVLFGYGEVKLHKKYSALEKIIHTPGYREEQDKQEDICLNKFAFQ